MLRLTGKVVYAGIVLGKILVLKKDHEQAMQNTALDAKAEIMRLETACEQSARQLQELYDKAVREVGENGAAIFGMHQMMLEDDDYRGAILNMIRTQAVSAEYAVSVTGHNFAEMFANMDDAYMRARAADVKDISDRLVKNLMRRGNEESVIEEPAIIVAEDLKPSEMLQMDREKILGFVTVHGSADSHAAILARMMNIPALTGVAADLKKLHSGTPALLDSSRGEVIFDPSEEISARAQQRISEEQEKERLLGLLRGKRNVTIDGHEIRICANIGSMDDVEYVLENDADGIGLFRSEFLYLERNDFPTEEEQYEIYRRILQTMGNKKVVIRTMDIGADKQADYLKLGYEANPAMGYRAIRICLKQPEIFKVQMRALFRAAIYGNLAVMYPMITSVEEVDRIHAMVEEIKEELYRSRIPFKMPEQGIMIETPAAVMISDELAEMVDFFSIGTNDLTQYALAVDRQNEKLEDFYNPHHKAILRMIQMTVSNAHKCGKRVGICGELGADPALTETFVRMGLDELSVVPSMVLKLRKVIREMRINE